MPQIPFIPNKQVYLITCIDPSRPRRHLRADARRRHRGAQGRRRVTDAVLDDLAWISYLHEVRTPDAPCFEIAVVHHTDCGSALMAEDTLRAGFVARRRPTPAAHRRRRPRRDRARDVESVLDSKTVCGDIVVSGYVYDIRTGLVTQVSKPAPATERGEVRENRGLRLASHSGIAPT